MFQRLSILLQRFNSVYSVSYRIVSYRSY